MANFTVNPGSEFWAPIIYGRHAPKPNIDPRVELVAGVNRGNAHLEEIESSTQLLVAGQKAVVEYTRTRELEVSTFSGRYSGNSSAAALAMQSDVHGIRRDVRNIAHNSERTANSVGRIEWLVHDVRDGVEYIGDGIDRLGDDVRALDQHVQTGFSDLSEDVRSGFDAVTRNQTVSQRSLDRIESAVEDGMSTLHQDMGMLSGNVRRLDRNMQTGFAHVGSYLREGFHGVIEGLREIADLHEKGFDNLAEQVAEVGELLDGRLVQLIGITAAGYNMLAGKLDVTNRYLHATNEKLSQILAIGHHIHDDMQTVIEHLTSIVSNQINSKELESIKHFGIGLQFYNNIRIASAKREFLRALKAWGGHFDTHIYLSQIAYFEGQGEECEHYLRDALALGQGNGRRVALAEFYLGRLMMERRTRDGYRAAHGHFKAATRAWPEFHSAMAERIVAHILAEELMDVSQIEPQKITKYFRDRGANILDLWYQLALIASGHNAGIARWLARYAAQLDPAAKRNDRTAIIRRLRRLNPIRAGILEALMAEDFPWMAQ